LLYHNWFVFFLYLIESSQALNEMFYVTVYCTFSCIVHVYIHYELVGKTMTRQLLSDWTKLIVNEFIPWIILVWSPILFQSFILFLHVNECFAKLSLCALCRLSFSQRGTVRSPGCCSGITSLFQIILVDSFLLLIVHEALLPF